MLRCGICKVNLDVKYRCPSCLIRYCSKVCYQKHKNKCKCSFSKKEIKHTVAAPETTIVQKRSDISYKDLVPIKKLEALSNEKSLQELLKNPHLRNLLVAINDSQNPEEIMQKAMQEPLFTEFADVCLNQLEPPSNEFIRIFA